MVADSRKEGHARPARPEQRAKTALRFGPTWYRSPQIAWAACRISIVPGGEGKPGAAGGQARHHVRLVGIGLAQHHLPQSPNTANANGVALPTGSCVQNCGAEIGIQQVGQQERDSSMGVGGQGPGRRPLIGETGVIVILVRMAGAVLAVQASAAPQVTEPVVAERSMTQLIVALAPTTLVSRGSAGSGR